MSDKMDINKAREIINYCKERNFDFFKCQHSEADYKYCIGFIEAWESRDAEVANLKKKLLRFIKGCNHFSDEEDPVKICQDCYQDLRDMWKEECE